MAAENGRSSADLKRLCAEAGRFDFFQAVRWLEREFLARSYRDARWRRFPVGHDFPPEKEIVRFRTQAALSFPTTAIASLHQQKNTGTDEATAPPLEMVVSFMGLIGPNGVLPYHYTQIMLQRLREKDQSLRDWLDLFHHRLLSLFFRAWEKYRLAFTYERRFLDPGANPVCAPEQGLYCLVGLGTPGLRDRFRIPDEVYLYFAGHYAHQPRNAPSLEALLQEYFQLPIRVEQLQGQWLNLEPDDLALLPSRKHPKGVNNQLGRTLVIGERVWDRQSKFRLRVGPLNYAQFCTMTPDGVQLRAMSQMVRQYVGAEFDFDIQPVLRPDAVPQCQLTKEETPRLGWNSWVSNRAYERPVADAVFAAWEG